MLARITLAAAVGLSLTAFAHAGDEEAKKSLTIGDQAPPVKISHWIKGKPLEKGEFEKDKVYVLEFWATWCGPCIASMPHLSDLQEKYKDYGVTMIGVSDEPLETVVKWLVKTDKQTEKPYYERPGYTLTTDPDKSTHEDFFRAAGQSGIPCAFIIGKSGQVEWIGHPMGMDEALEDVVRDRWDRKAFKMKWDEEQKAEREMRAVQRELRTAMQEEEWDEAIGILDGMLAKYPENVNLMVQKFNLLLLQADRPSDAYAVGHQVVDASWDNSGLLNMIAWTVVDESGISKRDLEFAMKAAARANELTGSKDPAILDTLARVHFEMGHIDEAIKWQRMAVKHSVDGPMGDGIREALEKYEKAMKKKGY